MSRQSSAQPSRATRYGGITAQQAGTFVDGKLRERKISKKRIAELLGVHQSFVSDLIAGRYDIRSNPERLRLVVGELGLSEEELLEGLGVHPVAYLSTASSRYLGRLEELPYPLPKGTPINLPPQFLAGRKPEDVLVVELQPGHFGVFDVSAQKGMALETKGASGFWLEHTAKAYRLRQRPKGEVLGRLVGEYRRVDHAESQD